MNASNILTHSQLNIQNSPNGSDEPVNLFPQIFLSEGDRQAVHIGSMACGHLLCGQPDVSTFSPIELEQAFNRLIQLYVFAQPIEREIEHKAATTMEFTGYDLILAYIGCQIMSERLEDDSEDRPKFAALAERFFRAFLEGGDDEQ